MPFTCPYSAAQYLGQGAVSLQVGFRGGLRQLSIGNTFESIEFTRRLDVWSDATVVIKMSECCDALNDIAAADPLSHELIIRRTDDTPLTKEGFVGPITTISYKNDEVTITARSLDWWWHRVVTLGFYKGHPRIAMEEIIAKTEVQLALGLISMPIIRDDDQLTGERLPKPIQADQLVSDLTDTGFHYTAYGRTIIHGEILHGNPSNMSMTTFSPDDFVNGNDLEVIKSGLNYSSRVTMEDKTRPSGYVTITDSVPEAYYGIAENLYSERSLDDGGVSVPTQARERLASQSRVKVSVPATTMQLAQNAPILFEELIPGMPVILAGSIGCVEFEELMSLGEITFRYDRQDGESISVELAPMIANDIGV